MLGERKCPTTDRRKVATYPCLVVAPGRILRIAHRRERGAFPVGPDGAGHDGIQLPQLVGELGEVGNTDRLLLSANGDGVVVAHGANI